MSKDIKTLAYDYIVELETRVKILDRAYEIEASNRLSLINKVKDYEKEIKQLKEEINKLKEQ